MKKTNQIQVTCNGEQPITLINGDCFEQLNSIPAKSVNLIIADLPYGTTKNKWDSLLDLEELWKHYKRILKDDGKVLMFCRGLFTAQIMMSNPKWFKYKLVWKKQHPSNFLNAKYVPLNDYEDICVFYRKTGTYNPQMTIGVANHSSKKGVGEDISKNYNNNNYNNGFKILNNTSNLHYPTDVLVFKKPHPSKALHPTQKPVELLEYLIKTYSNPDDLILDPTMGSGSTGVACKKSDRRFFGIERDKKYYKIATKRIYEL